MNYFVHTLRYVPWSNRRLRASTAFLCLSLLAGCVSTGPANPSFQLTVDQGRAALRDMAASVRPLDRPLLVVSGYMDSHASDLQRIFLDCTGDSRVIPVSLGAPGSLAECRRKIIDAVQQACPSTDPDWTVEVDVVGVSLGGLAARYAAACSDEPTGPRLRIARLFTIASPHQGAVIAKNYLGSRQHLWRDLRPGSDVLQWLADCDRSATYVLYPYARRHDGIVGDSYTAPRGQTPIWVPALPFREGHDDVWNDARILADIARRLRGETPFAATPASPLPS